MVMARRSGTVVDQAGNIVTNAKIEVRRETPGQPLAALKSDRDGSVGMSNPFDAEADGSFAFHVVGGAYQIRAYVGPSGAPTFEAPIERYVGIGLASEADSLSGAATSDDVSNESDVAGATVTDALNALKAGQREVLTGNRTYYVAPSGSGGSDANDGLTALTPFLTPQKAWNTILTLDLYGFLVTIQMADGTYTSNLAISSSPVGGNVLINGNSGTPANVVWSVAGPCLYAIAPCKVTVRNLEFRTSSGSAVYAANGGQVTVGAGIRFGACSEAHMRSDGGGFIQAVGTNYSIVGAAGYHVFCNGGNATFSGCAVTVTGAPAWIAQAVAVQGPCTCIGFNWTFSGAATGARSAVSANGVLNLFGAGQSTLPGNSNGTPTTGGQIV